MKFEEQTEVEVKKLKPYKRNNRIHPQEQIDLLVAQIAEHGFDQAIVCDEEFVILKGHARLKAAKVLKFKTVPCIVRTGLSDPAKRAIRIADNKLSELSTSDQDNLKLEMGDLQLIGYDMKLTGFDEITTAEPKEEPEPKAGPNVKVGRFEILLQCADENEQEMIFEEMKTREIKCVML